MFVGLHFFVCVGGGPLRASICYVGTTSRPDFVSCPSRAVRVPVTLPFAANVELLSRPRRMEDARKKRVGGRVGNGPTAIYRVNKFAKRDYPTLI